MTTDYLKIKEYNLSIGYAGMLGGILGKSFVSLVTSQLDNPLKTSVNPPSDPPECLVRCVFCLVTQEGLNQR